MPRPRKNSTQLLPLAQSPAFLRWAETIGEAMGRGMARAFNQALAQSGFTMPNGAFGPRRRGRPPKAVLVPAPPDRRCKVEGCLRPSRSKGLCSAHYQAERRKRLSA
ncbi:MAG: hypothetical protein ACJ790_16170 [Myxococcaceae bacterium]